MKPNYRIAHSLLFGRPNFIQVKNYSALNEVKMFDWLSKPKDSDENTTVGYWKIKYKQTL